MVFGTCLVESQRSFVLSLLETLIGPAVVLVLVGDEGFLEALESPLQGSEPHLAHLVGY